MLFQQIEKFSFIRMINEWRQVNKVVVIFTSILLIITWFVYFLGRYFLLMSLQIPLSFFNMIACVSLSTLFSLIPVSFNGIGIRDVSMIYLFSFYKLTIEQAVVFSMTGLLIDMVIVSFGYIPYFRLCSRFKFNIKEDIVKIKELFKNTK